jgi:beta-lactamase class A
MHIFSRLSSKETLRHPAVIGGVAFVAGGIVALGGYPLFLLPTPERYLEQHRYGAESDSLTNPLLSCDTFTPIPSTKTDDIDAAIKATARTLTDSGAVSKVSVYYRDLNNGPWVGYMEQAEYIPASLLKLPLMLAYLKEGERAPSFLNGRIRYTHPLSDMTQLIKAPDGITPGKTYKVRELLESMILNSDNNATVLLIENMSNSRIDEAFTDLGILPPDLKKTGYKISVRAYASFFRILYNASYLNQANSDYALSLLTKTAFKDGLVAGVPPGTRVAHKFGERQVTGEESAMHDCGIIYHPKYPYLLCVMTQGSNFRALPGAIAKMSKAVWDVTSADSK